MNAAISAAWKALPEKLRTEYKQRAHALKVGSALPSQPAALNVAASQSNTGAQVYSSMHARAANDSETCVAQTSAVNIAANVGSIVNDGAVEGGCVGEGHRSDVHSEHGLLGTGEFAGATENPSELHSIPEPGADAEHLEEVAAGPDIMHAMNDTSSCKAHGLVPALADAVDIPPPALGSQQDDMRAQNAVNDMEHSDMS